MTPCARSCCWTPHCCALNRTCRCHADERKPASRNDGGTNYNDPTASQAVHNVMKERRGK